MLGNRLYAWNTIPMSRLLGGVRVMSLPSTTIRPESGWSNPATSRSAVVLPHPLGPSSETNSADSMARSMPWSAATGPNDRHSSCSSTWATPLPSDPDADRALAAAASYQQDGQHRRPGDAEAEERRRSCRIRLRLVDVLEIGRERVEGRQAGDRELAHHDRERQERAAQSRHTDVRQDHTCERGAPRGAEVARRLRKRVHVDRPEAGVQREV